MEKLKEFLVDYITNTSAISDAVLLDKNNFSNLNIYDVDGFNSHIQFRNNQYQVQIFSTPSNFIIPEHKHPNVDSFEVYLSGDIDFSLEGSWLSNWDIEDHTFIDNLFVVQVKHDAIHGAIFGEGGGRFMSVQHWINEVNPSCVGLDYDGLGVSTKQSEVDKVKFKKDITVYDAAFNDKDIIDFNNKKEWYWNHIQPDIKKYENNPKPIDYFINNVLGIIDR